jgi:hypothetical protein
MAWSATTVGTVATIGISPSVETIAGRDQQSQRLDHRSFITASMRTYIRQGRYHPEIAVEIDGYHRSLTGHSGRRLVKS